MTNARAVEEKKFRIALRFALAKFDIITADNMNNLKNNIRRAPRQLARRKPACGCEPSSLRLSSKLFRLFSTTTDENLVFNDALGTTVGAKKDGKYSAAALTAFGEDLTVNSSGESSRSPFPVPHSPFFTGKPFVEGLGHAFLMRNYRAGLAKWQTADQMGYPDGGNGTDPIKLLSCYTGSDSAVFCQELANDLGVSVYAADSIVWYVVVERTWSWWFHVLNNGRMEPDKSRPGNFIEFMPE